MQAGAEMHRVTQTEIADKRMEKQTDTDMDVWVDGYAGRQLDGRMDRHADGGEEQTNRGTDRQMDRPIYHRQICRQESGQSVVEKNGDTDAGRRRSRQTNLDVSIDRYASRQLSRLTGIRTDEWTDGRTDRQQTDTWQRVNLNTLTRKINTSTHLCNYYP